ncbi:MAG: MaoC family dehydratase N-terminal domain-containing protein [Rhodobacteraceae bacterium]|jgi:hypothetical protein|nr:MaoC family dehydratase N-terminal domain-containing protein [Paracoccaceae bacterium]
MLQDWDAIPIGGETGRIEFEITDALIDEYVAAIELDPRLIEAEVDADGRRVAPLDLVPKHAMRTLFIDYVFDKLGPSMRAKQAYEFVNPAKVGMRVSAVGRISDKYERRGKRYVAFETTYFDQDGTPLLHDRRAVIVLGDNFKLKG